MSETKTKKNNSSVLDFIHSIENEKRRQDSLAVLKLMEKVTQMKPYMWGSSIVGFGDYHYKYSSGREGDWFLVGFSPRKQNLVLYIMSGFKPFEGLLSRLGKFNTSVSCLYIKKLQVVDMNVLEALIGESIQYMKTSQPTWVAD